MTARDAHKVTPIIHTSMSAYAVSRSFGLGVEGGNDGGMKWQVCVCVGADKVWVVVSAGAVGEFGVTCVTINNHA